MKERVFTSPLTHTYDGMGRAVGTKKGVVSHVIEDACADFKRFANDTTRAAFAHKWLSLAGERLEDTWEMVYALLKLVDERELFKKPDNHAMRKPVETFQEYFELMLGQGFDVWGDLEATYRYVHQSKPELLGKLGFTEARSRMREETIRGAETAEPVNPLGGPAGNQNAEKGRHENEFDNCQTRFPSGTGGNSSSYLASRIARDRPDILERMKTGEFRSVRAAAIEAGIITPKPRWSIPTDPDGIARVLKERLSDDDYQRLTKLMNG